MIETIFLDLDGVCCDFISASLKRINREDLINNWPIGKYNLEEATNISYTEIWKKIDELGSDFWRNLEEYPWFVGMYNELTKIGKVIFCSGPSLCPNSLKGKLEWLQDRFGKEFRDYILTSKKFYLATEKSVLIDDSDENCSSFILNGGKSILFPQKWNKNFVMTNRAVEHTFENLSKFGLTLKG